MKKDEISMFLIHPDFYMGALGCPPRIPPNATGNDRGVVILVWAILYTVNVEFFAQYIFSRRAVDARKYDVSEKMKYYSANRINC